MRLQRFSSKIVGGLPGIIFCLGLIGPGPLGAQTISKIAELKPTHYSSFFGNSGDPLLHPAGYVYVGREWLRDDAGKTRAVAFAFVHLPTQQSGIIELPYAKLLADNAELLTRGRGPAATLVAFDGRRAGFVLRDSRRAQKSACVFHGWDRRFYFFSFDTETGEVGKLREIGAPGQQESFYSIAADEEYLYYASYSRDAGCGQYQSVALRRVALDDGAVDDWRVDLKTRGVIARPRFTGERKYLAILNYTERGVAAKNPPDAYIIDPESRKTWRFRIPVTPYAIACDEAQCLLGSSQAGTISRLRLDNGKVEAVAKGLRLMNHIVPTPGGGRALIFWNSITGPKFVQARDFPGMGAKNMRKYPTGKIFGAPRGFRPESMVWSASGRYLLIPKPGQNGFPDDESVLIFEVRD